MLSPPTDAPLPTADRDPTPVARRARPRLRAFCRTALGDAAAEQGIPVDRLIALIDGRRGRTSLATAAERFVAAYFHARAVAAVRHPGLKEETPLLDDVLDRLR